MLIWSQLNFNNSILEDPLKQNYFLWFKYHINRFIMFDCIWILCLTYVMLNDTIRIFGEKLYLWWGFNTWHKSLVYLLSPVWNNVTNMKDYLSIAWIMFTIFMNFSALCCIRRWWICQEKPVNVQTGTGQDGHGCWGVLLILGCHRNCHVIYLP